jgi:hypothetical protein
MRLRVWSIALLATTALALALTEEVPSRAFADYAPSNGDVIGVGADTMQYGVDFLADGDAYGDVGYNLSGDRYKLVGIDATADSNGRLAYGVDGGQSGQVSCTPGTGAIAGTGNSTGTNAGVPCVLNPAVVLRAGSQAVPRPGSSAAGYVALVQDDMAGHNNAGHEVINLATASALQSEPAGLPQKLDAVIIGDDRLVIAANSAVTNAVPLSAAELKSIYSANAGSCVTWNMLGGFSTDPVIPLIPPVGSGARSFFLAQLGLNSPGTCAVVAEQDDPTALVASGNPVDAVEPMSQARLDLYAGITATGAAGGLAAGYFPDPSCAYLSGSSGCGSGSVSGHTWSTNSVVSPVSALSGPTFDGTTAFTATQPLYVYFRHGDITSATAFQPGTVTNWVNALFYDPCQTGQTCQTVGGVTYGPGGAPYIDQPGGQVVLDDAGITPVNSDLSSSYVPG